MDSDRHRKGLNAMASMLDADATTLPVNEHLEVVAVRGGRIEVLDDGASVRVGPERLLVGRARRCALVLDDKTVSAVHAEVQATPRGVRLVDLNSRNGTFVGDLHLTEGYLVQACEFRCGAKGLRFVPEAPETVVVDRKHRFGGLVGTTPEMLELFGVLRRFAPSSVSIVIRGETGTGKERVARAIHEASPRRHKPFLAVNCAAMPDTLLEAELFGHVRGAFTGADQERKGLFVEADGGTLLFDEVAEMSPAMQAKLLRALENKEVRPIGSARTRQVDVRTLFATHADLRPALNQGRFREDLYFRIAKVTVEVPPLRRRLEDLGLLLESLLEDLGRPDAKIDDAGMAMLATRTWPGNLRELRNLLESRSSARRAIRSPSTRPSPPSTRGPRSHVAAASTRPPRRSSSGASTRPSSRRAAAISPKWPVSPAVSASRCAKPCANSAWQPGQTRPRPRTAPNPRCRAPGLPFPSRPGGRTGEPLQLSKGDLPTAYGEDRAE